MEWIPIKKTNGFKDIMFMGDFKGTSVDILKKVFQKVLQMW